MIKHNYISIFGRLTAEPELRQMDNGDTLCNFTVAVPRPRTNDKTDFVRCTAWNQSSKFLTSYGHKGDKVLVEGGLQVDSYTDKDGNKREKVTVNVQAVSLDSNSTNESNDTVVTKPAPVEKKSGWEDIGNEELPF